MISTYLFYFLSFIAIFFALLVVFSKKPINSVLYLVLTFFCIAGHYILLNAQFLAAVHIMVYAGAIMVLFLFVLMLLNLNQDNEPNKNNYIKLAATILTGLFFVILIAGVKTINLEEYTAKDSYIGLVKNLGYVLFTDYLFPFEVTAVLLFSAIIGAIMLGKK